MSRGASRVNTRPSNDSHASRSAKPNGAEQSKKRLIDVGSSYWKHHITSCMTTFKRLLGVPLPTLMTTLVVAIALALPAVLLLALGNIQYVGKTWDANPKVSLYIHLKAKEAAIDGLVKRLSARSDIGDVNYISREEALHEFQRLSGFGSALDGLDVNPLPALLEITPLIRHLQPAQLSALAEELESEAIVDQAIVDMDWVRRLLEMMALGHKIVYSLASLLALGALVAIGNTVRLAIESRRDEIIVAKLVGATDSFVRRPFLYTGIWYGIFGGILACGIVLIGFLLIADSVKRLAYLYRSDFILQGLGVSGSLSLLILSAFLGWCGAWLAVRRHLVSIQPS